MWLLGIGGIGAALFLIPGALPAVINGLSALLGLIRRNPWPAAVIALCVLSVVLWRSAEHARDQRDTWHRAYDLRVKLEAQAARDQIAANKAHTALSGAKAGEVQHDHVERGSRADSLAVRYIDGNRVRTCPSAPGSGNPAAEDHPAPVPAGSASDPILVVVPASDVKACTADWTYAMSAHELAVKQVDAGLAEWGK